LSVGIDTFAFTPEDFRIQELEKRVKELGDKYDQLAGVKPPPPPFTPSTPPIHFSNFKFQPGDIVRCIDDINQYPKVVEVGHLYCVRKVAFHNESKDVEIIWLHEDSKNWYLASRFKKAAITDGPVQDKKYKKYRMIR
jgi:hypothetical protein